MIAEDLDAFLDDFGVPVSSGVVSGVGILDQNSEIALGGEAVFIDYLLTVKASTFGALTYGDQVSVDGVSYKVESQPLRIDDGTFCRVPLIRSAAVANNITTLSGLRLVTQDGRTLVTQAA